MPLPALSDDNTRRIKLTYQGNSGEHTLQLRPAPSLTVGGCLALAQDVVAVLRTLQWSSASWSIVELAAAGSDVFDPIGVLNVTGAQGGEPQANQRAAFLTFGGRAPGGRRWSIKLFETYLTPPSNFRYEASENAGVDAVLTELQALAGAYTTIGGTTPLLYTYVNAAHHAYWQQEYRSGA